MSRQRFEAVIEGRPGGAVAVRVPFDPATVWGDKDRHHVTGSIAGCSLRGRLAAQSDSIYLQLGPAWNCGRFASGDRVSVELEPEGPQLATLAPDFAAALEAKPDARRFFESLATFYRKGYVRWIEGAKRPETRQKRLTAATADLAAARAEHS